MKYIQITSIKDSDIPFLISVHRSPEISRFISINEKKYFKYVTEAENVFYYKVFDSERLVASVHCELEDTTLFLSLLVIPDFQRQGIGTAILSDIKNGVLPIAFKKIYVSIDEDNSASLQLFKKAGFSQISKEDKLIDFIYNK
ncbi:MAG: GNAT family N-acetyltransferase [Clostridia bacterium]|nr:GNAT family N-acetyltransferase [Clostridia bacterium]